MIDQDPDQTKLKQTQNSQTAKAKLAIVTGASGFVGSHLVDWLLNQDYKVIGIDNFITGRRQNLAHLTDNPNFKLIEADVSQPAANYLSLNLQDVFFDQTFDNGLISPEFIFHLASPASPPRYQAKPVETYLVNSIGTHYLLDWIKTNSSQTKFIFASTSETYGDPAVHPQPETYWGNVNPNGVRACYDESKRMGEAICGVFHRNFDLDVRIARIFNTYGPRMDPADGRVIPNFIKQAETKQPYTIYGDGSQTRSYCYISDLVEGLWRLGTESVARGQTINLGNPGEYTVLETAKIIHQIVRGDQTEFKTQQLPLPGDDPTRRQPDITKAKQILNWQPQVEFAAGLKQTVIG